jgi:anti-anti-sigma factor
VSIPPQVWKGSPFTIERKEGKTPGEVIFRLSGPFTARDMYGALSPAALRSMLDVQPMPSNQVGVNILDLTEVPYMDSTGLGMLVSHYVRCQGKGVRLVATGLSPRVRELFKMTKVDTVIPMTEALEDAGLQ